MKGAAGADRRAPSANILAAKLWSWCTRRGSVDQLHWEAIVHHTEGDGLHYCFNGFRFKLVLEFVSEQ